MIYVQYQVKCSESHLQLSLYYCCFLLFPWGNLLHAGAYPLTTTSHFQGRHGGHLICTALMSAWYGMEGRDKPIPPFGACLSSVVHATALEFID